MSASSWLKRGTGSFRHLELPFERGSPKMRFWVLLGVSVLLIVVDRVTTWVAIGSESAREINPFVETENFARIVFSPIPLAACVISIVILVLSEKHSNRIHSLLVSRNPLAPFCLFPLMFIWMMTFVCINNILGVLGFLTILTWLSTAFSVFTDSQYMQFGIAMYILNIAGLPLLTRIGLHIYAPK